MGLASSEVILSAPGTDHRIRLGHRLVKTKLEVGVFRVLSEKTHEIEVAIGVEFFEFE